MKGIGLGLAVLLLFSMALSATMADVLVYSFNGDVAPGAAQPPVVTLTATPGTSVDIDLRMAAKRSGSYGGYPAPIQVLNSATYSSGRLQIPLSWLSTPGLPTGVLTLYGPSVADPNNTIGPSLPCTVRLTIPAGAPQGEYAILVSSRRQSGGNNPSPGSGFQIMLTTGDSTPPAISSVHLGDTIVSAGAAMPVEVNASDNTGVTSVTANGSALALTSGSAQAGLWSGVISTTGLAEGDHTVTAIARDAAGLSATDTSAAFTIDNTDPDVSISGVSDGAYYSSAVTLTVSVTDTHLTSSSITLNGQPYVSGTAISADGSYTLAAAGTDAADNTTSKSVSFIIDTQAPAISIVGAADGDYRKTYESISYLVTDSNLDGSTLSATLTRTAPDNASWPFASGNSITVDGVYTLLVEAADLAGNEASQSITFTADSTAPEVAFLSPVPGPHGYVFNTPQTISYSIFDALDPSPFFTDDTKLVSKTLAGDSESALPNDTLASDQGQHAATIVGSDHADNTASATLNLLVDTAAPQTGVSPGGLTGNNGWFIGPVTITLTPTDPDVRQASAALEAVPGSGILDTMCDYGEGYATYEPANPPTISADGIYSVMAYSTDVAGNEEVASAAPVKIDMTAPAISINPVASPTNHGSQTVTGSYTETNLLGIDVNSVASSVSGSSFSATIPLVEGNNAVIATAEDEAGHKTSAASVILLDTVPPVSGAVVTEGLIGQNGWYRSDVKITIASLDQPAPGAGGSAGVDSITWSLDGSPDQTGDSPTDVQVNGDAIHSLQYYAIDLATNQEADRTLELKIDATNPVVTASCLPGANSNGWNNTDVTVTFAATDNLSGVAALDAPAVVSAEGAAMIVSGSATDTAGNTGLASATVNIDKTDPEIVGSVVTTPVYTGGGQNWYSGDVAVSYSASDALSGLAAPQSAAPGTAITLNHTVTGEGAGLTDSASATDKADNEATAMINGINIDRHGPTITILGVTNGASYPVGAAPTPSYNAVDALSGLNTSSANLQKPSTASGAGQYTYSVSAADNVGNASAASAIYSVVYGGFNGFLQPINADGSSVFKLGSTIPVKFQLKIATGGYVRNCVAQILCAKVSDGVAGTYLEAASTSAADAGNTFRYSLTDDQYIFNLSTKWMSAGTWIIRAVLDDGTYREVRISLRK